MTNRPWMSWILLTTLCFGCGQPGSDEPQEPSTPPPPTTSACEAPTSWFPQSQTPKPNAGGTFENPCDFHKWAWQSFLWLTQDVGGELRFTTFPTSDDVIDGDLGQADGPMVLKVRTDKNDAPQGPLDEINQAGESGILVAQNGRAIYYQQHLNPMMAEEIVGKQWNDPEVLREIDPTTTFATGDVELKSAWMVVEDGENTEGLFTRTASIDQLTQGSDGTILVDTSTPPVETEVALVGLHVVGWVEGHPEAIWATFEFDRNAPDFAKDQSPTEAVSSEDWLFYQAGTLAKDCNQLQASQLELHGQELSPVTQVCRQYPFGMVPDPSESSDQENLAAITSLNSSVKEQLAPENVWKNYFEVGAIWTNGQIEPNNTLQANLLGSTLLGNAVIETFNQAVSGQNNCFQCHNTMGFPPTASVEPLKGTNLNLSHVIQEAYVANSEGSGK